MTLLDFQTALGRLVRAPDGSDPLRSLRLTEHERSRLDSLTRSAGYRFTVEVQRSWCVGRATSAGYLTLSILPTDLRARLLDEWTNSGGGTSSFFAAEAEALLDFIATHLPNPSHELTACRLEQATLRANEGVAAFSAPDSVGLDRSPCLLGRGRHAGIANFHGEPHPVVSALLAHKPLPPVSSEAGVTMLFAPGLDRLCRPASEAETDLWQALTGSLELTELLRRGHHREDVAAMLQCGALEYTNDLCVP
jgi:hypothetical protein